MNYVGTKKDMKETRWEAILPAQAREGGGLDLGSIGSGEVRTDWISPVSFQSHYPYKSIGNNKRRNIDLFTNFI